MGKEVEMQDRRYLLSLEEISDTLQVENQLEEDRLLEEASSKLDRERLKKLENIKHGKSRLESLGAGLLLQLAVQEALCERGVYGSGENASEEKGMEECRSSEDTEEGQITYLTFSQLFDKVQEPLPLEYTYGEHGKPYLKNYPFYFNISHSGKYVFCVLSEQEIGADIQWKAPQVNERVLKRFFSLEERAYWERCSTEEEKRDFFYQMWCRKEAYGKLTGKGIADAVSVDMCMLELPVAIEEYELSEDYQIAVCKWK